MTEGRVKVSHLAQFGHDPTRFDQFFVTLKLPRGIIACNERREDRFGGEHATFDRGVDAFDPLRIEKACAVAYKQHAVRVELRHRVIAAGRNGLCAVAQELAACEQAGDEWMLLE